MVKKSKEGSKEGSVVKERADVPLVESPEALLNKLSGKDSPFVKYRNVILGGIAIVVLAVAGFVGYRFYVNSQDKEAQSYLFPAAHYFETDSLKKALKGDGSNDGLTTLADNYGATKAGGLANFYAGVAYLKEGKYDEAIQYLKDFSSSDLIVQARAYSLLGDAYSEKKDVKEAINYYKKAAEYKPNKYFTPVYLMKLATAYEQDKDYAAAIEAYDKIITNYFDSSEVTNAKKYKSKLEGLANN
ncbi:MAG: tetratricopeptide repeat protein [Bacteroidota bacterium]